MEDPHLMVVNTLNIGLEVTCLFLIRALGDILLISAE